MQAIFNNLPVSHQIYLLGWIAVCCITIAFMIGDRSIRHDCRSYAHYMLLPWKIIVFIPAGLFVTFAGSYAYDDTWDMVSGGGMSALTYLTAPWAVGAAWQACEGKRPHRHAIFALVMMLFSASWFYDGWLLYRDGSYTDMWLPNLLVSPFLYVGAGILWNLETGNDGKPTFGFMRASWPMPPIHEQTVGRLFVLAAPFAFFGAAVLIGSVRWRF